MSIVLAAGRGSAFSSESVNATNLFLPYSTPWTISGQGTSFPVLGFTRTSLIGLRVSLSRRWKRTSFLFSVAENSLIGIVIRPNASTPDQMGRIAVASGDQVLFPK